MNISLEPVGTQTRDDKTEKLVKKILQSAEYFLVLSEGQSFFFSGSGSTHPHPPLLHDMVYAS